MEYRMNQQNKCPTGGAWELAGVKGDVAAAAAAAEWCGNGGCGVRCGAAESFRVDDWRVTYSQAYTYMYYT